MGLNEDQSPGTKRPGGEEYMKTHALVYWRSAISLATAVFPIGIPWNLAVADGTVPRSAPAAVATPQTVAAIQADARTPALPFGVSEVVKLYQGGIGKDVIVNYIENTVLPFHLTADGETYLQHLGMPQEVMSALIRRDGELQRQSVAADQRQPQQATAITAASNQVAATPNPPLVMSGAPPPVVSDAYPDASAPVVYPGYAAYPYYGCGYPYFYGPDVIIGGGFSFGRGFGRGGREFGGSGRSGFSRGGRGGSGGGGHGVGHR
jgi:hypothetical protein